jgi:hypothetical protein
MSAQINLYDPRFLKVEDWLNLRNLVLAAVLMVATLGLWAFVAQRDAAQQQAALMLANAELDNVRVAVEAATQQAARAADPHLVAEVTQAQTTLTHRETIAQLLETGAIGSSAGFSDYLRGFSRQTPNGLWLTGFSLDAGGHAMEIRGSTYDEKLVPDYIRRVGNEAVFRGRIFSALSLRREPAQATETAQPAETADTAVSPAPTFSSVKATPRQPLDFVLAPATEESKE